MENRTSCCSMRISWISCFSCLFSCCAALSNRPSSLISRPTLHLHITSSAAFSSSDEAPLAMLKYWVS